MIKKLFFILVFVFIGGFFVQQYHIAQSTYPEVYTLEHTKWTYEEYADYFDKLAKNQGARYAFEVLKAASLPEEADLHNLGHVIGDELYIQEGVNGMAVCTHDFRSACAHAIVIGLFSDQGVGALPTIIQACKESPGGNGSYEMCFHGLGHGIVAYFGYDFEKAIQVCTQLEVESDSSKKDDPYTRYVQSRFVDPMNECVGGAVMEMTIGSYDTSRFEEMNLVFMPQSNPLLSCNAAFMPEALRPTCYLYMTEKLLAVSKNNYLSDEALYAKAFSWCNQISQEEIENRDACFGGFGKQFVFYADESGIRDTGNMSDENLLKVIAWCNLAGDEEESRSCVLVAQSSLFWASQNSPHAAARLCELIENQSTKKICRERFIESVLHFADTEEDKITGCSALPKAYQSSCFSPMY